MQETNQLPIKHGIVSFQIIVLPEIQKMSIA